MGAGDQLGARFDQLVRRETPLLRDIPRNAEHLSAEFHGETRGDKRAADT